MGGDDGVDVGGFRRRVGKARPALVEGNAVRKPKPALPPQIVRPWSEVVIPSGNDLERLTYVPGAVGDITEWIVSHAVRPNRMMSLGSALITVGTLIGHRIQGPTKSATHLYIINLAPTGAGKDHPLQAGPKILAALGRPDLIGPSEWASSPGLIKRLKRNALMACFIDELGDELAKVNAKGGGGGVWLTAVPGLLKKCYNAFGLIPTAEKVDEQQEMIDWPAVSILGAATPEKFFSSLGASDIESGFANRLLILPFEHYRKPPEQTPLDGADEPPAELLAVLRGLPKRIDPGVDAVLDAPADGSVRPKPPLLWVRWGDGADEIYRAFSKEMDDLVDGDRQRYELSQRTGENAARLATIVAVGRGATVVECKDIAWAIAVARRSLAAATGGVDKYMQQYDELPRRCDKMLEWLKLQPDAFATDSEIHRKFGRSIRTVMDIPNVLTQLQKERRIERGSRSGSRGFPADGYCVVREESDGEQSDEEQGKGV
jgi:hypothetical protein